MKHPVVLILAVTLALPACDSSDTVSNTPPEETWQTGGEPLYESGSRLHRRYVESESGEDFTLGFYDTELDTPCRFSEWRGELRCFPNAAGASSFVDAECTIRGAKVSDPCDVSPDFALHRDFGHFRLRDKSETVQAYYENFDGECVPDDRDGSDQAWEIDPVPSDTFVAGVHREVEYDNGLTVRYIDGADGSQVVDWLSSTKHGYFCQPDPDGLCLPLHSTPEIYTLQNEECTRVKAMEALGGQHSELYHDFATIREEGGDRRVYRVGEDLGEFEIYTGEECKPEEKVSHGPRSLTALGEEVSFSEIPRLVQIKTGPGRLKTRRFVVPEGHQVAAERNFPFYDSELDNNCAVTLNQELGGHFCQTMTARSVSIRNECSQPDPIDALSFMAEAAEVGSHLDLGPCNDGIHRSRLSHYPGAEIERPYFSSSCSEADYLPTLYERGELAVGYFAPPEIKVGP